MPPFIGQAILLCFILLPSVGSSLAADIQNLLLEKNGITGGAAIPYVRNGMMLWGIGGIFGYIAFGYVADIIGRRPTIFVYSVGTLIFGLVLFLLVNSYDPYPILLPIYGFFVIGIFSGHEPGDDEPAGRQSRILTIDKGRFTVRRARLAPAMISTPGHRASRRRQRGALPAWSRDAFAAPSTN